MVPAGSELRGARSTEIWDERRLVCARELLTGLVQALTRPRARRDGALDRGLGPRIKEFELHSIGRRKPQKAF